MGYNRRAMGIVIGRLRVERGWSQETLSALAGISRSHLALLENGRKSIRLDTLWNLATALGIAPHELIALVETEE